MKTKDKELAYHSNLIESFLSLANVPTDEREVLRSELKRYIERRVSTGAYYHPAITKFHAEWFREFYRVTQHEDPYKDVKQKSDEDARNILQHFSPRTFKEILMVTIIANKLDFAARSRGDFTLENLQKEITQAHTQPLLIDDSDKLIEAIPQAKNIFYFVDNHGEIIFDALLLEYLRKFHPREKIFIIAKEMPMINDVTLQELKELGYDRYGTLVSTGTNCFGPHEEEVSPEFRALFKTADLIIAKGQGYLEFFMEYNFTNIFHLTRIKHTIEVRKLPPLAAGSNIILHSARYAGEGVDYHWDIDEKDTYVALQPKRRQQDTFPISDAIPLASPKIKNREEIGRIAQEARNQSKTIVTLNGCFDLLHIGHIKLIDEAKKLGDLLIIGVNSDESVKQWKKLMKQQNWFKRPINSAIARAEALSALTSVDFVEIFNEPDCLSFLENIKPNIHVNGEDYGEQCIEAPLVKKYGGKIHIAKFIKGFSTSHMIKKIVDIYGQDPDPQE